MDQITRMQGNKNIPSGLAAHKNVDTISLNREKKHKPDYILLGIVAILTIIGWIAISSTTSVNETTRPISAHGIKHGFMLGVGFLCLFILQGLDYRRLAKVSPLMIGLGLALLSLLFIPSLGQEVNGARSWLKLPGLPSTQPSELVKLLVIIYMSAWLAAKGKQLGSITSGILPFILISGSSVGLILLQPDIGTAFVLALVIGCMFFVAPTTKIIHIAAMVLLAAAVAFLLIISAPYRWERILAFIAADSDPEGFGYQAIQLANTFGSGGLMGQGLGLSRQKFFYLPAAKTDGIMAVIGEETGFIGSLVVIILLTLLLWRCWLLMRNASDMFGSLLATGVAAWIAFQSGLNISGATNLLPLTGVPLPLISYGGSSLISLLAAVGILLSVSRYTVDFNSIDERQIKITK